MAQQIQRSGVKPNQIVAFATAQSGSTPILFSGASGMAVFVPAGVVSTTISWYAATEVAGPYKPVILSNGAAATTAVSADTVAITPPELFPCHFIKGVAGTAFTGLVMLKS